MLSRITLLSVLLLPTVSAFDRNVQNFNQWFAYWGDNRLGQSKWSLHFDSHVRRNNLFRVSQQYLVRPGVNYHVNPNLVLHAAYTFLPTFRYGKSPALPQTEHRIWEQATFQHRQGKIQWFHRGRFEQRWLSRRYIDGTSGPASTIFEERARYTLRASLPIGKSPWYWSLGNEVFFPFPPEQHPAVVDQHRIQFTVGKRLSADLRLEYYYMYQNVWQRNGRIREDNHVFGIAFWNAMPLQKMLRLLN